MPHAPAAVCSIANGSPALCQAFARKEPVKLELKVAESKCDFRSQERISPLETTYLSEPFHALEEQSLDSSPMTTYYDGDLAYIVENCPLRRTSRQRRTLHSLDMDALLMLFSIQPTKAKSAA